MRNIDLLVVHCSDSDIAAHDNVATIREWHRLRGFTDIGYHYVITKDGTIHEGRPIAQAGAHVKGHNQNSIGICVTGRKAFTQVQFDTLRQLLHNLMKEFKLEYKDILHHRDLDKNKSCPNFNVSDVIGGKK